MVEKDIGRIQKKEDTDIVVRVDEFGGYPGVTIREFATSEKYTGFTKSGTRIPAEKFEEFKALINSINPEDLKVSAQPQEQQSLNNQQQPEQQQAPQEQEQPQQEAVKDPDVEEF